MTLILDSGALEALDNNDRAMWIRLKGALRKREVPVTHAGVLGQVWTIGGKQERLELALSGTDIRVLDEELARNAGRFVAATDRDAEVLDAALVLLASDEDEVITADPARLKHLALASGRHLELIPSR